MKIILLSILTLSILTWLFSNKFVRHRRAKNSILITLSLITLLIVFVIVFQYTTEEYSETVLVEDPDSAVNTADTLSQSPKVISQKKKIVNADSLSSSKGNPENKLTSANGASINYFPYHKRVSFGPQRRKRLVAAGVNPEQLESKLISGIEKGGNSKSKAVIEFYLTSEWIEGRPGYLQKAKEKFSPDVNLQYFNALVDSVRASDNVVWKRRTVSDTLQP